MNTAFTQLTPDGLMMVFYILGLNISHVQIQILEKLLLFLKSKSFVN